MLSKLSYKNIEIVGKGSLYSPENNKQRCVIRYFRSNSLVFSLLKND